MSWAPNHGKGMPYGGMPADSILQKLEVTDLAYLPPGRQMGGQDSFTGLEEKDDAISALLDRRPDPGFLAAGEATRNPQRSREAINLRYNGTRGSHGDLPRHSEMFVGFTGDDPRGAQTDPRFEQMREQMTHRMNQLVPQMGENVGHGGGEYGEAYQEAERPWTGPSLQAARVKGHIAARDRMKVFSTAKEGRSTNGTVAAGRAATRGRGRTWRALADSSSEHWAAGRGPGEGPSGAFSHSRLLSGEVREGYVSGRDAKDPATARKMRYASENTMDLPVARYGMSTTGKSRITDAERSRTARADRGGAGQQQQLGVSKLGSGVRGGEGNRAIAATMSAAAQSRRAGERAGVADGVRVAPADGATAPTRGHSRQVYEGDVAKAYYQSAPGQAVAAGNEHAGRAAISGASIALKVRAGASGAAQALPWRSTQNHARAAMATTIAQAVRNPGTHASTVDTIEAAYKSAATGARQDPDKLFGKTSGEAAALARGRGVAPGDNAAAGGGFDAAKQQVSAAVHSAAASRGLEVANYSGRTPVEGGNLFLTNLRTAAAADGGQVVMGAAAAQHLQNEVAAQKHPEYVGQTQTAGHVESREREFGLEGSRKGAYSTAHRMGRKAVRYDRLAAAEGDSFGEERLGGQDQISELISGLA